MRMLVTGAGGLLGSHVASMAVDFGHEVWGTVRPHSPHASVEFSPVPLDLGTEWSSDDLPSVVDVVVHLAQSPRFREFPDGALDVWRVNSWTTSRLAEYARLAGARQFIYASTGGVYRSGPGLLTEDSDLLSPAELGAYAGSKLSGEIAAQTYSSVFSTTVFRPFFIYGPGQRRSMLLPRMFDSVVASEPITLHGESGLLINPIHVLDASTAIMAAIERRAEGVFNLCGPENLSLREIASAIGNFVGRAPVFEELGGVASRMVADPTKLTAELHRPSIRIASALPDLLPPSHLPG